MVRNFVVFVLYNYYLYLKKKKQNIYYKIKQFYCIGKTKINKIYDIIITIKTKCKPGTYNFLSLKSQLLFGTIGSDQC